MKSSLVLSLIICLFSISAVLAVEVPLVSNNGTYELPIKINGVITLNFVLDSGASEVNIPADVALTLLRTGTIKEADFLPGETYTLADGSKMKSPRFKIEQLEIGGQLIKQVTASIGPVNSSLLLGQSFLSRIKSWSIDNVAHSFTFSGIVTVTEFLNSAFQDDINMMLCTKLFELPPNAKKITLPKILDVYDAKTIRIVHVDPPHREFPNLIIFKDGKRVFEALTIGIIPETSKYLDLHTIGHGVDIGHPSLLTYSANGRIAFDDKCKHFIRHYLSKNGMVAIPYEHFVHTHLSNGKGSEYTIDKTMFYDLACTLFGPEWKNFPEKECTMYDLPPIKKIKFEYTSYHYIINSETSNGQLWTIQFDDIDDDYMYLINKKITVKSTSHASR